MKGVEQLFTMRSAVKKIGDLILDRTGQQLGIGKAAAGARKRRRLALIFHKSCTVSQSQ